MSDAAKLWMQSSLNQLAINRAIEQIQNTGRALPCSVIAVSGSIVRVKFEVTAPQTLPPITLPKAESQWLRAPTQVGDLGMTVPADTYLGGISGLGGGVADLTQEYGNLTTLVWVPVGSSNFGAAPNPNKAWLNGIDGVVVSDTAQKRVIDVDSDPAITMTVLDAAGTGASSIVSKMDGAANSITHQLTGSAGTFKTIVDGNGNAISHVIPTGGLLGLGDLAGNLGATRAVPAQADLETAVNSTVTTSMVKLMAAVGAAIGSSSGTWSAAQAELNTIFAAADFVPNISGIMPTIPGCSSLVRVAS